MRIKSDKKRNRLHAGAERNSYSEMILFDSDYTEGAHPSILKLLNETNMEQTCGYGEDEYCEKSSPQAERTLRSPRC